MVDDLGTWTTYKPNPWPSEMPPEVLFAKRDSDGVDWYEYLKTPDTFYDDDVIAVAALENGQWIIKVATRDATRLWPAGRKVLVWTDETSDDPQTKYGEKVYNGTAIVDNSFIPVPQLISDRQFFQQLAIAGIITEEEALAANAAVIPSAILTIINGLPAEIQFSVKMLISGATVFEREHPMTEAIGAAYGWTANQIDDFFRAAAQLV